MDAVAVIVIHRASRECHLAFVRFHAIRPPGEQQCRLITRDNDGNKHSRVLQIRAFDNRALSAALVPLHNGPYVIG